MPDFDPIVGGTSVQARRQAEQLILRGVPATVLTRRRSGELAGRETVAGLPVRRLPPAGWGRWADKTSVLSVGAWLAAHRRRLTMVQVVMYPDYALAASAAGLADRTVMIWAGLGDATDVLGRTSDIGHRVQSALRRRLLRRCRHVALTSAIEEELATFGVGRVDRIGVPVDTARFRPPSAEERRRAREELGVAPDAPVIAYVGHLRRLKGVDRLVSAFAGFARDHGDARLLLVGGGAGLDDCEHDLREQVRSSGLADMTTFAGPVADVERFLWAADVFVLPSHREGMPNSLVEAMACGLACVAGPEAGGGELLTGGAGMVPSRNEPDQLLAALRALWSDPDRRAAMGRAAHARAQEMSSDRVGERYYRLYEELCFTRGRPGPASGAPGDGDGTGLG